MKVLGLQYGVISCYQATWLVNRHSDDHLLISDPFMSTDEGSKPTTMGALAWLQCMAISKATGNERKESKVVLNQADIEEQNKEKEEEEKDEGEHSSDSERGDPNVEGPRYDF